MAIIVINYEKNIIEYAGANNSIFIIKEKELKLLTPEEEISQKIKKVEYDNCLLYEIKPDRMPIGKYRILKSFSQVEFSFKKDDMIYLFTDGFTDQFGGSRNKKFSKKRLMQILAEIHDKPASIQKKILEEKLDSWQKNNPQTDDITLMGIKLDIKIK